MLFAAKQVYWIYPKNKKQKSKFKIKTSLLSVVMPFFVKIKDCDGDNIKSCTDIPRHWKVMNVNYIQKTTS